jgi:hypothetical protein
MVVGIGKVRADRLCSTLMSSPDERFGAVFGGTKRVLVEQAFTGSNPCRSFHFGWSPFPSDIRAPGRSRGSVIVTATRSSFAMVPNWIERSGVWRMPGRSAGRGGRGERLSQVDEARDQAPPFAVRAADDRGCCGA